MTDRVCWGNAEVAVEVSWSPDQAPRLTGLRVGGTDVVVPVGGPLVEVLTVGDGHAFASNRLVHTAVGERGRYVGHTEAEVKGGVTLALEVHDAVTGLTSVVWFFLADRAAAVRSWVEVRNDGVSPSILRSVASWSAHLGHGAATGLAADGISSWTVHRAVSDWLGEGRWTQEPANRFRFPDLGEELTGHNPRGEFSVVSTGTWSTGKHLPVAALSSESLGVTWAWQVEHNGGWRWEFGQDTADGYVALSGPTDADHQWLKVLAPGEQFQTVPVAVTVATDFTAAVANLTGYRRVLRRHHSDNTDLSVVFNDYMNTLNGDPTTERLLPLIDAAAEVGVEVFCIDAGWYDDGGHWWDSVGEWEPSTTRFPGGLGEVVARITSHGMVPGLWLEPEVVGVNSPVADSLPGEAFLQRAGQRVVEQSRYHLDLRHPAARAHLDAVVTRLVEEFGIGFLKLDYNINPGAGTDVDADSAGDGLLGHNRAHLAWLDGVLDRHPHLILENCGSGAMRADFSLLSRMQLQSTSDQQDWLRYPSIAATAPVSILPEQAANWAYPQPAMTEEEVAFALCTGLLGRFYLSGYLNQMSTRQLALVRDAVRLAHDLKPFLTTAVPFWPLGLPDWDAAWVVLGLTTVSETYITVWNRAPEVPYTDLPLNATPLTDFSLAEELMAEPAFPVTLIQWGTTWDVGSGVLHVHNPTGAIGARTFRVSAVVDPGDRPSR